MVEKKKNLLEKLVLAQQDVKAPKGQYNKFGKYQYRSAEDILEAVKPINAKYGFLLTLTDELVLIGNRYYIKATAEIKDTESEDIHSVVAFARESEQKKGMDDSQITGTASSYARKYALNGLYLIDDTKDADTDEYKEQQDQKPNSMQAKHANGGKVITEPTDTVQERIEKGFDAIMKLDSSATREKIIGVIDSSGKKKYSDMKPNEQLNQLLTLHAKMKRQ